MYIFRHRSSISFLFM